MGNPAITLAGSRQGPLDAGADPNVNTVDGFSASVDALRDGRPKGQCISKVPACDSMAAGNSRIVTAA